MQVSQRQYLNVVWPKEQVPRRDYVADPLKSRSGRVYSFINEQNSHDPGTGISVESVKCQQVQDIAPTRLFTYGAVFEPLQRFGNATIGGRQEDKSQYIPLHNLRFNHRKSRRPKEEHKGLQPQGGTPFWCKPDGGILSIPRYMPCRLREGV